MHKPRKPHQIGTVFKQIMCYLEAGGIWDCPPVPDRAAVEYAGAVVLGFVMHSRDHLCLDLIRRSEDESVQQRIHDGMAEAVMP